VCGRGAALKLAIAAQTDAAKSVRLALARREMNIAKEDP
jgi:hypothetical protein